MPDRDSSIDPTPLEIVREVLRRRPDAPYYDVVATWRARHPDGDLTELRREYEEEVAQRQRPSTSDHHDRTVLRTAAFWILAHLLIWVVLSAPDNFRGIGAALAALLIGGAQLLYGPIVGFIIRRHQLANSQGVFIGTAAVALLHTVLCFGVVNTR